MLNVMTNTKNKGLHTDLSFIITEERKRCYARSRDRTFHAVYIYVRNLRDNMYIFLKKNFACAHAAHLNTIIDIFRILAVELHFVELPRRFEISNIIHGFACANKSRSMEN